MMEESICFSCETADGDDVERGAVRDHQPYLAIGYHDSLPLHDLCAEVMERMASECLPCRATGAKRAGPLSLFVVDDGPLLVAHEGCMVGGTEILLDGTLRRQCLMCRQWAADVNPYDLGDGGGPAWLDGRCARRVGGQTSGEAFQAGFTRGLLLGAIIEIARNR